MSQQATLPVRAVRTERLYTSLNGYAMALVALALVGAGAWMVARNLAPIAWSMGLVLLGAFIGFGLYMLKPNEGVILTLFGRYQGTDRSEGLRWANPLQAGQKISLRA